MTEKINRKDAIEFLESWSGDLNFRNAIYLLFMTTALGGVVLITSKGISDAKLLTDLGLVGKIGMIVEIFVLLMAAGNSIGAWALSFNANATIGELKRKILRSGETDVDDSKLAQIDGELVNLRIRMNQHYKYAYYMLAIAVFVLIGVFLWFLSRT